MIGFNGNLARGDFLIKYEGANISGASVFKVNPDDLPTGLKKTKTYLVLVSITVVLIT